MKNLLDTCVISEYKKPQPNQNVIKWLDEQLEESLFISVLTIGEIEKGIAKMPMSKRKDDLELFLENLVTRFDRRILPIDVKIMRCWGKLVGELENKGRVLPIVDSMIAATALENNLTIITQNVADFADTDVNILNIWKGI